MMIARSSLLRFAPHASAAIQSGICDRASVTLPKWGFTSQARVQMLMAHMKVETEGLTRLDENLTYTSAQRLFDVFGKSHFPTVAAAEPYVRNPEALANKVYGGRLGNIGPDDGWLNRGQGLLDVTGGTNLARLAKQFGVSLAQIRSMLASPEHMLECACATFVMLGAIPYADAGDVLGATKKIQGGTQGLKDRSDAYASARQIWPSGANVASGQSKTVVAAIQKPPTPPSILQKGPVVTVQKTIPWYTRAVLYVLGVKIDQIVRSVTIGAMAGAALGAMMTSAWADQVDFKPLVSSAINEVLVPVFLTVSTTAVGVVGTLLTKYLGQKNAQAVQARLSEVLNKGISFGSEQVKQWADRQDFKANVDGWIATYAAQYAVAHAPDLMKQAGAVGQTLTEKILARIPDNLNAQVVKSLTADSVAMPVVVAAPPSTVPLPA